MKSISEIVNCLATGSRPLTCESCGKEFNCGASLSGCWCGEIKLTDEARAELKERYRDCLCRDCLEKISNAREP
ncbi:MAG TPA: cysteine-rich CWC family protein [Pyrinomonadaceae bacterium]|nr:cysteine-rich CWC family protein [Pyrinomonadaceae bacterium]